MYTPQIEKRLTAVANQNRDSSFELLRIISMFCIVLCHFATHGGFVYKPYEITIPRLWWLFIELGGNLGVNIFVLISGYFLSSNRNNEMLNIRKITKLWSQLIFYSIALYFFFVLLGTYNFSVYSFLNTLFPITTDQWWFASAYFVLYLIHPILNVVVMHIDKKTLQYFVLLLIIIWCCVPTIFDTSFQSNNLIWFITLYILSAYIRIHGSNQKYKQKHYIVMFLLSSFARYSSSIILIALGSNEYLSFYKTQSIFTFLSSLSLFMIFKNLKMRYHKAINIIASATFGVYLIHDNANMRDLIWNYLFKNNTYQNSILIIPYSIIFAIVVYLFCTFIDLLRKSTFEVIVNKFIDKSLQPLLKLLKSLLIRFIGLL